MSKSTGLKSEGGLSYKPPLIKSPLRYPGGKSRAIKTILNLIPTPINRIVSPFLGGGSIELALVSQGVQVYAYDAFIPLVAFWEEIITAPLKLAEKISEYYPLSRDRFYTLQDLLKADKIHKEDLPAVFYVLNRASFSGTTLSGGMSPGHPRFTESSIKRVREFKVKNLTVKLADFKKSIPKHNNDFLYCDPPYLINQKLYGKKGDKHINFDHNGLATLLNARGGWVLSYNDCQEIRDMYKEHQVITPKWIYGMGNSKKSNEVLILSKDLPKPVDFDRFKI